jgi:Xaa-Pro aminopeptidase
MSKISSANKHGNFADRRKAAMAAVAKAGARNFLVSRFEDVSYLTGFSGDDSILLAGPHYACLLTDGRYDEQARAECPDIEIYIRQAGMAKALAEVFKKAGLKGKLAVQAEHMTLRARQVYEEQLRPRKVLPVSEVVTRLREVKDASEVEAICKAIAVAQDAFLSMLRQGKKAFVGRTERQIAADLDYRMRLAGADKPSFDTIVAVGPHGSLPHYRPADTVAEEGQPVLIDWGAAVGGYVSDLTRVVFLGTIPPKLAEIYEVTLRAQAAGIAAFKHNATLKAVDAAARDVIAAAGYGDKFIHSLGHGIGRVVHEMPGLSKLGEGKLKAGMVVTAEPGIYLPGVGGVRIEDDVEVTAKGARVLSTLPRKLQEMLLK